MKKKILFIHPFLPYPMLSGGHQALYNGIMAVRDDFDIYLAYYDDGRTSDTDIKEFRKRFPKVTLLPMDTRYHAPNLKMRILNKLQRMIAAEAKRGCPEDKNAKYNLWLWANSPQPAKWQQYVNDVCTRYKIDIVQVEMPWISSFILSLPDTVRKVYVHHELAFVRHALELRNDPDNIFAQTCYKHTLISEIGMLNHADHIVTLSPVDKRKLEENGVTKPITASFAVVNTGTDHEVVPFSEKTLSFVGPDNNQPNVVGLKWFLDNCWEKLKAQEPAYRLKVIGRWNEAHIEDILSCYPDVEFVGFVDSLYDALKGTTMIVPITIGSGIRMKILEAAGMGVSFVSTSVGAEGIPLSDGKDCFLTDDPATFIKDIIKLQDNSLRDTFIANARRLVKEHYSLDALRRNRMKVYETVEAAAIVKV